MHKTRKLPILTPLIALLLLAGLMFSTNQRAATAASSAQTVILITQGDAMVHSGTPTVNYGAGSLGVTANNQSYVWFDLSNIPANATIDSATLMLMPADIVGAGPHSIGVGRVQDPWSEATVTWNTKPGTSVPGVSTSVGAYVWQSWDTTPLVRLWHAGTVKNYGFALLTGTPGVYFHSKETGPAPRLVITASLPPDDDPDQPAKTPFSDLGDAPDSTNNHGQNNTAYPGTPGQFPTVYLNTPAGQPAGPRHANVTLEAILGENITREQGADGGADADGVNNILRNPPSGTGAVADTADNDRADDGWRNRNVPILNCERSTLVVRIRRTANSQLDKMYLNVFYDGNQDGDWADTGICQFADGQPARAYEWIVQDHTVDLNTIPVGSSRNISVTTLLVHSPSPNVEAQGRHWMRFTLSDQPVPRNPATNLADGRGPNPNATPKVYAHGETEDILYSPDPKGEPGELSLEKEVIVPSTPVGYADTVTYTVRLMHTGGTEPVRAEIRDVMHYPQHILPYIDEGRVTYVRVKELAPGISPLDARIEYRVPPDSPVEQVARWKGTLAPDAQVELSFHVHVHPVCQPDQNTVTLSNTVTLHKPDGTKIGQESVTFEAACPGYSLNDIEVSQEVITDGSSNTVNAAQADAADIMFETVRPRWQGTFTNQAQQQVTLGFSLNFEKISFEAAEGAMSLEPTCQVITLEPGESRTLTVWTDMRPLSFVGNTFPLSQNLVDWLLEFRSRLRYALVPPGEPFRCGTISRLPASQVSENLHTFQIRPWDLGDAPDSSNHPGVAMTAYPGIPANFPTVFDVTTGAPEGPRHARPRPFHLGPRVEFEPDADLGPAPRNISPTTNTPNRDRYDDGVALASIAFQDCQTTTFQARVYISPAAQAAMLAKGFETGYINSWVDSNRDGNWASVTQCSSGPAPEHIVIDQEVDIASLAPGLNTLTLTTSGPVSWPTELAQKPAWLRVMLSEEKSVKLTGLAYGDGRGPASGYRTGETEDYLLHPKGQGADLTVNTHVTWEPVAIEPAPGAASADMTKRAYKVHLQVEYANEGSDPALGSSLIITPPAVLQNATLLDVVNILGTKEIDTSSCKIALLGTLEPGEHGSLVCSWMVEQGEVQERSGDASGSLVVKFAIRAFTQSPDAILTNNENITEWRLFDAASPYIAFALSESPYMARNATTSGNTVDVRGTGEPGAVLSIFADGFESGNISRVAQNQYSPWLTDTVTVDANGEWLYKLTGLKKGLYRVRAANMNNVGASDGPLFPAAWEFSTAKLNVDPNLPIDPLSMIISDNQGRSWTPDTLNFNIGMPPTVFVPGRTYTMRVQRTPGKENLQLSLDFLSPFNSTLFEDIGGGTLQWSGCLTCIRSADGGSVVDVPYALVIMDAGEERVLEGKYSTTTPGYVTNASTGAPVNGALVRLLVQTPESETVNGSVVYEGWDGGGGQQNPQTTGGDGGYLFVPPEGTYRVQVTAPGYQSYTGEAVSVAAGEAVAQAIALTPVTPGAADVTVSIGPGGFDPGVLVVPPGTTVRWVNVDVFDHSVVGNPSARVAGGFDSGLLGAGDSYSLTVNEAGTINLSDQGDPFNQGVLIVDPNAPTPGMQFLYLPSVTR